MKVWAVWQDNGIHEAPSLIGLYSTEAKANEAKDDEGLLFFYVEEIEVD
jgi:hypothetical protein